ncbi:O-antigen ligase family protein [Shewanella sp. KCT]|uniref:O-antigen ligase family protein n=1 Tax=Shewanella sp. KCT TaxID=2569535 RepID=UPI00118342E0|nr:O-antigen ligase family protein [Shewanella sp. KCT]TVP10593.1 hypothetical protein AYI87_17695 [Shewanella sp. KCT]
MITLTSLMIMVMFFALVAKFFINSFYVIILLASTSWFGIISNDIFGQVTPENIIFCCSLSVIPLIFISRIEKRVLGLFVFPLFMVLLFIYGVFVSYNNGNQLALGIVDGKQMLSCLLIIHLIINIKKIKINYFSYLFLMVGVIYSVYLFLALIFNFNPPGYLPVRPDGVIDFSNTIHIPIIHYIFIGVALLLCNRVSTPKGLRYLLLAVFFIALIIQSHSVVLYMTIISVILSLYFNLKDYFKIIVISVFFSSSVLILLNTSFNNLHSASIESRLVISAVRIDYILDNPYFGYGFVHEDSKLGKAFSEKSVGLHDKRMGTVDSGYLDMSIRFGVILSLLSLVVYARFCYKLLKFGVSEKIFVYFLALYIPSLLTWSLLSYNHGILMILFSLIFILTGKKNSNRKLIL